MSASRAGQLVIALDRDGRAVERRDSAFRVGEGDQRVERADLGPGGHGRGEDLGPERAAGVDHRLAAVHPERAGQRRRSASSGTARMISSTSSRIGSGSAKTRSTSTSERNRSRRAGVTAGDGVDRPAGTTQGDAERGPDGARPDDADDRRLARGRMGVRVGVVAGVRLVVVPVGYRAAAGRGRSGRLDGGRRLGPVAAPDRRPAGRPRPSSSVGSWAWRPVCRRQHPSSVASRTARRATRRVAAILAANFDPGRAHPPGAD